MPAIEFSITYLQEVGIIPVAGSRKESARRRRVEVVKHRSARGRNISASPPDIAIPIRPVSNLCFAPRTDFKYRRLPGGRLSCDATEFEIELRN